MTPNHPLIQSWFKAVRVMGNIAYKGTLGVRFLVVQVLLF